MQTGVEYLQPAARRIPYADLGGGGARSNHLPVGDGHSIFYEESGSPEGIPVVFVHGGPGAWSSPEDRTWFDAEKYRIIRFDQRGCGNSTPSGCLTDNTTQALVEDMERLRVHLGAEAWALFGGSWGATLALCYATTYPDAVLGLVLRGVCLFRRSEVEWLYEKDGGAAALFPDKWAQLAAAVPAGQSVLDSYARALRAETGQEAAARRWLSWEEAVSRLVAAAPSDLAGAGSLDPRLLAMAQVETHFMQNAAWLEGEGRAAGGSGGGGGAGSGRGGAAERSELLERMGALCAGRGGAPWPVLIVQGRYDLVCPVRSAWQLWRCLTGSQPAEASRPQRPPVVQLRIVPDAGHSSRDPSLQAALLHATECMSELLAAADASAR